MSSADWSLAGSEYLILSNIPIEDTTFAELVTGDKYEPGFMSGCLFLWVGGVRRLLLFVLFSLFDEVGFKYLAEGFRSASAGCMPYEVRQNVKLP